MLTRPSKRDEIREDIINRLEKDAYQRPRFAPNGLEKDVLTNDKLTELFRETLRVRIWNRNRLAHYVKMVRGDKRSSSRLKILAILIYHNARLDDFVIAMKNDFAGFPSDGNLPLDQKTAKEHFRSPTTVQDFVDNQAIFLPLQYKDTKSMEYQKEELRYRRDPIVGEPTHIGCGASGRVERIEIAKGHFMYDNGSLNPEPLLLARKVFDKQDDMDSSAVKYFRNEDHILAKLNQQASTHKHLMLNRGSLIERDGEEVLSCTLFYDLAICNLWEILDGRKPELAPPRTSLQDKARLISQYCDLVHALNHLHDGDIIHVDIKPDNILVMEDSADDTPGYVWKLADYNLSVANDEVEYPRGASSVSGQRPLGTYQAPEVQGKADSRVGWWTDLWSLGCIFLLVLAYADDGLQGVKTFERHRREHGRDPDSSTTMDTFYTIEGGVHLNPGVSIYIANLRERARSRDPSEFGEGHLVNKALGYLEEFVLITDSKERRGRKGDAKHGTRNFWERMDEIKSGYEIAAAARQPLNLDPSTSNKKPRDETKSTETEQSSATLKIPSQCSSSIEGSSTSSVPSNTNDTSGNTSSACQSGECTGLCKISFQEGPDILEASKQLEAGEKPDEVCLPCEVTPLHNAIVQNIKVSHMKLLDLFLKAGDRVNIQCLDRSGRTPLDTAVENGQYNPTESLLQCYEERSLAVNFDALLDKELDSAIRLLLQQRRKRAKSNQDP